ncbi:serine/threonine-protein kinase [Oceaniglobus trochenteri]|uniref:serine/threonine-protein kinase n=1 Tax=Oceaniglobus trochenteri TaxID=2763260 RepID=UPI001D0010D7|nr:serine/threonine-protein kinase [Oceaniglobus trochenteri]
MTGQHTDAIFQIGDLLNNTYRIEAVLGRGGTSEVYRARSEISGQPVALKALRSEFSGNDDFLTLMTREEAIREVRHDAIVRYFHNQRTDTGVVFLVMDYVEGVGLDRKMKEGGMSAPDLLTVAARVAEGLAAAHAKNITHRDLSPDNIILRGGDPADAVIIDFGIAKDSNPGAQTIVGNEFAGKYAYAAPEQLSGNADFRSDIYALGALLLATFRGKAPDVGANPMEVIANKGKPLDTSGVPAPLRQLIDRMTAPDPADRLPDAAAVLAMARGDGDDDGDRTVIAPLSAATVPPPEATAPPAPATPAAGRGRGGLIAAALVGVLVLAGGGAWFGGFFGTALPRADPFVLSIARSEDAPPKAQGNVPSQDMAETLSARLSDMGGSADLTLARGDIAPDWPGGVLTLLDLLRPLDSFSLETANDTARVGGLTESRPLFDQLSAALADPDIAPGLVVEAALELGPRVLAVDRVDRILSDAADCGELSLLNPPATGYGQGADVVVMGRVATPETRAALRDRIAAIAGTREVRIETDVLNPALCVIDEALPRAPAAGFDIAFSQGDSGAENPSGRFLVGENPVIDVTIPADITDGFLIVSALDVSGNVFHLLPNKNRPDDSVEGLRDGASGPVTVRVAFPLSESQASGGEKLAFLVDDTSLGKTKIMVIHSESPILGGLRPTTESAEGFATALRERSGPVRSLDSRILTTALP